MTTPPGVAAVEDVDPVNTYEGTDLRARSLAVDARGLHTSGIGRYLRAVLREVLQDPRFHPVTLLGHPEALHAFVRDEGARARVEAFPHSFYAPAAQAAWAALRARGRLLADVTFFPHYDVPLMDGSRRLVVTVHDLAHFRLPEQFPAWRRAAAGLVLRRALRRAHRILTGSRTSAKDLAAWHPGVADRLEVVPYGVSTPSAPEAEAVRWAGAYRPFLLCVGNRKPHKNLTAAVEVLARLRSDFPALRLVIAGRGFGTDDGVTALAAALGVGDAVVELGEVEDARLNALYGAAECLLFPSIFEGFGLPVLEAMAAGLPVVASDFAAVAEAAGGAAALVPPYAHDRMADAVRHILTDDTLRAERVRQGRARAAQFSWAGAGRRTADVLYAAAHG
jgi:glycosyltransferase involved in cell wall biosynthesis